MMFSVSLRLLVFFLPRVIAHYVFSQLLFNDTVTEQWEYVRNVSIGQAPDSGLWDQYMPFYNIYSEDVRCGRGASTSGEGTKTATVVAGDDVGFVVGRSADEPLEPFIIYHNGPGQAYLSMSTVPDLSSYEGDGDWYKIGYLGAKNDSSWVTRDQTGMNFTIPESTPPGDYLLRAEHLYLRPAFNTTQFYMACAQIRVLGLKGVEAKMPGAGYHVKFPGGYGLEDEGILVADHIYEWPLSGLLKYTPPGPPLWAG